MNVLNITLLVYMLNFMGHNSFYSVDVYKMLQQNYSKGVLD